MGDDLMLKEVLEKGESLSKKIVEFLAKIYSLRLQSSESGLQILEQISERIERVYSQDRR